MEELLKLIVEDCQAQSVTIPLDLAVSIVMRLEKLRRIEEVLKEIKT